MNIDLSIGQRTYEVITRERHDVRTKNRMLSKHIRNHFFFSGKEHETHMMLKKLLKNK